MKLTARQISTAKPTEKPYKLSDGGGLYLLVNPNGSRYWRMKYRYAGKEKLLSIGVYPDVTLAEARDKRTEAKRMLAAGDDPSEVKQAAREAKSLAVNNCFELLALEWHEHKKPNWSSGYADDILEYLKKDIFPYIGKKAVTDIKPVTMLSVLKKMEDRGVLDKLKKTRQACRQIFTYAIITGRAEFNPVADLAGALKTPKQQHFPHLMPAQIGPFIQAVNAYTGSKVTRAATLLLMYTSVRTIELRASEWAEFDLDNDLWQIPKERMKMRRPHLVPLSRQVKSHLLELKEITGWGKYVFPGRNDARKPMSEASINQVIKRIGFAGRVTGHGFRHTMSTVLHEKGFNSAWIEAQLAHADRNTIRGTYNHAQYLDGRREMLQWYADYLDELAKKPVG
ncbi:tyrosine-type recombinase/integrase [Citrobacter koseri]|uniref:tyrosine-type recombinase/integrase n=1 Tax=Citrobacter koseri TaxID=545 RepID=UPI0019080DF5|nr:integrase arm-type DNA-binding domain-containing protein [Citrobacter koseri]EKX8766262.1 tyrosine-type recombinase/integrase [Citrobacter koseri]EMD6811862.1 tyrosine-type recombinase/integrase [Citrobacter koseri]MBJ9646073.1 tyrosine-type recombinase/integrase [Citrobacter koseri]HEJ0066626.1 tyrosine-type recombinase/integrase [Citrobacter koseri]HEM8490474.1 tyrosine-type recombinase/integrase [Citrobacter koseri]